MNRWIGLYRKMNITWTILNHWQKRAMEGMLQALEPHVQLDKGVAALFGRYREVISRRDLQALINSERIRQIAERREGYDEVHWQGAGIVWAMDDTVHNERDAQDNELYIHHVRDIGARYSLAPMAGTATLTQWRSRQICTPSATATALRCFLNATMAAISILPTLMRSLRCFG